MNTSQQHIRLLALAGALVCALVLPSAAQAEPVMLNSTVTTLSTGLFRYEYSVANTSTFDFSAISISVTDEPNAVQNLFRPTGFRAFFDAGLSDNVDANEVPFRNQFPFVAEPIQPSPPGKNPDDRTRL